MRQKAGLLRAPGDVNVKNALLQMQSIIKKLEDELNAKSSYAQAAQRTVEGPTMLRLRQASTMITLRSIEEKRKMKSLIIKVSNEKERDNFRMEHTKNILDKLRRVMDDERKSAELRHLLFEDLKIQTTSLKTKRWAEDHSDWTKAIAASAGIIRRSYDVLSHGVRMTDINIINQIEAIKNLLAQNVRIHKGAKINRSAWTRKIIEMKKTFSSLIETHSSATINSFIKNGIIINHEIKTCKLLCRESRLIQCFNCQKYGHIGRACKSTTRCEHCAAGHSSTSWNQKNVQPAIRRARGLVFQMLGAHAPRTKN